MSDDLIQLLSEGSKRPVQVPLEPEGVFKLQRRERKPRLRPNGRPAVINNRPREERFKPSAEMLDVRNDIGQARLHAARAYNRLTITGNGTPDFRSLEKFKELVRKVTLLENKYKDMEVAVRAERQAKREAEIRSSNEQKERVSQPFKVSLKNTLKGICGKRSSQRARSEVWKNRIRKQRKEQREFWRQMRMASRINDLPEKAKDALAEGLMELGEFRSFMETLDTDPLEASADALAAGIISLDEYQDLKAKASL